MARPGSSRGPAPAASTLGVAIALVLTSPTAARAFTEHTAVTDGCHERMTLTALGRVGWPEGSAPPPPTRLDQAVADDLPFPVPENHRDPWTIALLLGVRHPDLAGLDPTDLPALAELAAKPENQADHCLRAPDDDGPEGDISALAACRARIRGQVELAIGEGDAVDLATTEPFHVWLTFRDTIELPFPRFAFRMGLALHALQDAFSHVLRDPASARVRHVLNYVDPLHRGYREERDGHEHESALDECTGGPESRTRRVAWAADASTDLLAAVATEANDRGERLARVDAVLDRWLAYATGCTIDNGYCDAPELDEPEPGCSIAAPGARSAPRVAAPLLFALAALVAVRRRRRAWPALLLALLAPSVAAADETDEQVRELALEPEVQVLEVDRERDEATVVTVEQRELSGGAAIERGPGFSLSAFGGMDEGVLGFAVGPRFDVIPWMIFGADLEYEAWISLATGDIAEGVVNAAFVADFIYGKIRSVELRGHVAAGISVLLFDLAAADQGSTGPFAGFSPLGVAIRATRSVRVVLDPAGLYFSVPQLRGVPLVHRHHRFTVAVQITP